MRSETSTIGKTHVDWRGVPWIETQHGYVTPVFRKRKPMSNERYIRLLRTALMMMMLGIVLVIGISKL